jgi:hypothetical protein
MKKRVIFLLVLILISFGIAITTNAIQGSTISDVSIRPLIFYYETFDGSTSDFSSYNFSMLQDFPNAILEKSIYGKVVFLEEINFSLVGGNNGIVNFDSYFNISQNLIYANPIYLPNLDKSATLTLRGLSFSNPYIVNGVSECSNCEIISYSGGVLTFNTTNFDGPFYAAETSTTPEDEDEDEGGDTGGGGGGVPTIIDEEEELVSEDIFYVEPKFLIVEMNKGEYFQRTIKIFNNGTNDLNVTIYLVGEISSYLFPDQRIVNIKAGTFEEVRYDIYFSRTIPADVYTGKVIFSGKNAKFEQEVILDVKTQDALFDIRAIVLKRYLFPGARARANVSIINMGDLRNFDVDFEYKIIDFEKNVYSSKREYFAMNHTYSNIFFLDLPEDIEIGDYLFYVRVLYPPTNVSASAYDMITVEKVSFWTWLLLILIIILIGIYVYYKYKHFNFRKGFFKKVEKEQRKSELKKASPIEKEVPKIPDEFE